MLFGMMDFGELCLWWIFILGLGGMALKRMVKKAASNESIRNAAKAGAKHIFWSIFKK